ncbi:MAG: AMP-binding protein [Ideonella sp.]
MDGEPNAETALALTRAFLTELHPGARRPPRVTLDSALERDLGLDSLSRVELAVRLERGMGMGLTEQALGTATTIRELLAGLQLQPVGFASAVKNTELSAIRPEPGESLPAYATTLIEVLEWHARAHPDQIQIICLADAGEVRISYRELLQQADTIAAGLQRLGLEARQTVAIMLPTSPDYFYVYFGILRAGAIPVPIYPPARLSQIEEHVRRHTGILANAQTSMLITVPEARVVARLLEAHVPGLRRVVTVAELGGGDGAAPLPEAVHGDDIAFIQYTSGSTGDPKGVVLTHANLLANMRAIGGAIDIRHDDVFVSWLPLYHDMGLICAWLSSLYHAIPLVVMSPLAFLAHPERWLRAIQQYRGTISAAPNFAYELCVKRITDAQIEGLDLSSWRLAANGAEPVMPETLRRFTERFADFGFRPEAMTPVYGLAESTVGLLSPPLGRGPRIDSVRREPLSRSGRAEPAAADDPSALRFVSCGRALVGHAVRIVDDAGHEVDERIEGRLQFKGPSATQGYYRNPQQTARLFDADWLETGDRAYMADAEVYLTGRSKDIIIRGGRNIYPHELEDAVGSVPGVRRGCVAVFGSPDPTSGTERLVVLAETLLTGADAQAALRQRIVEASIAVLGQPPDDVLLAPPQTVLKTSSGKIRRAACRELFEAGKIGARRHAAWWQVTRLVGASLLPQARRMLATGMHVLHGVGVALLFGLLALPVWSLTTLARSPAVAWRVNRSAARLLLRLAGIKLVVNGIEHLPRTACVLVANHASYLDGLALFATLPLHFSLVAKREFLDHTVARLYLRGLGVLFVERFDLRRSADDAQRLADVVEAGNSLALFPEGTFERRPGLRPFRLGAFAAAVAAQVPVLPVAIHGTRALLPDGEWLPRRGTITVSLGEPVLPPQPPTDRFKAAVALRDGARAFILAHCGEADAGIG